MSFLDKAAARMAAAIIEKDYEEVKRQKGLINWFLTKLCWKAEGIRDGFNTI